MSPLNPYFLQGSPSEQRLVQDLINEQLKIYGQDVVYMPRKFISEKKIIKEAVISKFNDSFRLEAYIANYEGFSGQGDILSKFGVRTTDGITFIISKERYEDFISPFINGDVNIKLSSRPQEGDLIYVPLDNSLFEIKYVEGKKPFYQLNNLYIFELRCEIFEYEDEVIDTGIEEVDMSIQEFGYIQTLEMVPSAATPAIVSIPLASSQVPYPFGNSVYKIDLINDGHGYLSSPKIEIDPPPIGGIRASAVAIMTSRYQQSGKSIDRILITNPGIGYTVIPNVKIKSNSSNGTGGIATAIISTGVLGPVSVISGGVGYSTNPFIGISSAPNGGTNAIVETFISSVGILSTVYFSNAGFGYTSQASYTITSPIGVSTGNYVFNEEVTGEITGTKARVKEWDALNRILKVSIIDGNFHPGESVIGMGITSGGSDANYRIKSVDVDDLYNKYSDNVNIEEEAIDIIDFSETNPFGYY